MTINQISELNTKEQSLTRYFVELAMEDDKPSITVSVNTLCKELNINIKDERNKHEALTEALVNIISVPTVAAGKQIPFIEGWELDTEKAVLSFSPEYLANKDEANIYLLNFVCNPNKMSFILT